MRETWVWSLGWEDLLEKGKAICTPVFWPGEFHELYSPWGCKESDTTEQLSLKTSRQLSVPTSCSQGCSTASTVLPAAAIGLCIALALTWTWLVMLTLPQSCCFCYGLSGTPTSPICPSSISTSVPLCPDCTMQVMVWCPQALLITEPEPTQYHSFKQSKITQKVNKMSFLTLDADKEKWKSEVAQSCLTFSDPMDYSPPGPPSMGFSRQEYWSGVPLPSPLTAARHIIFTWSWYTWWKKSKLN